MTYTKDRVPAFVNAFAPLDDVIVACGAGAIALGFPVITNDDKDVPAIPKSLIIQKDVSKFNATSLEARDIKIKITKHRISRLHSHLHLRAKSSAAVICRLSLTVPV